MITKKHVEAFYGYKYEAEEASFFNLPGYVSVDRVFYMTEADVEEIYKQFVLIAKRDDDAPNKTDLKDFVFPKNGWVYTVDGYYGISYNSIAFIKDFAKTLNVEISHLWYYKDDYPFVVEFSDGVKIIVAVFKNEGWDGDEKLEEKVNREQVDSWL